MRYTSGSVLAIAVIWSSTAISREVPVDGSTSGYVRYSSESRIAAMETSLNTKLVLFLILIKCIFYSSINITNFLKRTGQYVHRDSMVGEVLEMHTSSGIMP